MSLDAYQPRVLPRVFSDLPSQQEVQALRRSRSSLTVFVVLFLGMAIVAVAGLIYFYNQVETQRVAHASEMSDLRRTTGERVAQLEADNRRLQGYEDYSIIENRRARARELRGEIASIIELKPFARSIVNNTTYTRNQEGEIWSTQRSAMERAVEAEERELAGLRDRVHAAQPAPVRQGPSGPPPG